MKEVGLLCKIKVDDPDAVAPLSSTQITLFWGGLILFLTILPPMEVFSDDVLDRAWLDFWQRGEAAPLLLHTSYGTVEEMPVDYFFRNENRFPPLEHYALSVCRGRVLDIGAGTGVHASYLQRHAFEVTALEISLAGSRIQRDRGIQRVVQTDYRAYAGDRYDTVLLLMNGIGVVGTLEGLRHFLQQAAQWLRPQGQLLFDSSDIAYVYEDEPLPSEHYYGEIRYRYEYQGQCGDWFSWLYVNPDLLKTMARAAGWHAQVIFQDDSDQYLIRLTRSG